MVHTKGAKSVSVYALIQSNLLARILVIRLQRLHNVGETTEPVSYTHLTLPTILLV